MKIKKDYEKWLKVLFVLFAFGLYFIWSLVLPLNEGPDEIMKYDIIEFLVKYNRLPHGGEAAVRDVSWGFSYAYFPILPYMVGALFVKLANIFHAGLFSCYVAARFVSVLLCTGMTIFHIGIAEKLFTKKPSKWLFIVASTILPQVVFIGSYINNDSLALFSVAMMVYFLLRALEKDWDMGSCIGFAAGAGLCAMSYYNAYGYLLTGVLIYLTYFLMKKGKKHTFDGKKFWSRAGIMVAVAFAIAGWWFIRSAILYHGDFLGMASMDACAEKYAIPELKPSLLQTPQKLGQSLAYMYIKRDWFAIVYRSFIGVFGPMKVPMPLKFYACYYLITAASVLGMVVLFIRNIREKVFRKDRNKLLFGIFMAANFVIPFILSTYYSYCCDFQPQGRYVMPALLPVMFFLVKGLEEFIRLLHFRWLKITAYAGLIAFTLFSPLLCLKWVMNYYGTGL